MNINILGFAIPFFISFILLEYFIAKKKKLDYYNLHHSIANISIGLAERLCDVFASVFFYFVYDNIQKKYGIFHIESSVALWLILFLLTDFIWYWYHRWGHEVNLFWMAHIVHHQSEDYNYTAGTRVTVFQAVIRTTLWSVLPFIGFPAAMITSLLIIHGVYPFFIHTRLIGKLGVLEYILVTPSHHRVHHASNDEYLDKNYGDMLIIWDKLFGTFQKEREDIDIKFGLTKPLRTFSFLWQHFHYFFELALAVKQQKGFWNKLKILFSKPDTIAVENREKVESFFNIKQNQEKINTPLNQYVVWQMLILLVTLFLFLLFEHYFSYGLKTIISFVFILTLINCGAIMEQKRWIFLVEFLRLSALLLLLFYSTAFWQIKLLSILVVLALLITFYTSLKNFYLHLVYKHNYQFN